MGEKRKAFRVLVEISEGKRPLGRSKRSKRIILTSILEIYDRVVRSGLIWPRIGTSSELL
jgi:hypothetical protein